VLPAVLARDLGTAAPTAYLSGAAVMALVALAFAEAGRRTTVSGGPYAYVERAFGQFPGYLAGLLTWLATIVACGAVGAALVDSLATMVPTLHHPVPRAVTVAVIFGVLALVNVRGVRAGTALASAAGVAKFIGLVLFVLLAARFVQAGHLAWTLPAGGMSNPFLFGAEPFWQHLADVGQHMILPAATLMLTAYGSYTLVVRSSMLETLGEDYVLTARAKGLPPRRVVRRHAFRNALLPVVTLVALDLGYIVGGALLIEVIFSWPGIGLAMYDAIGQRDYPMLQGGFLILTVAVIVLNFAADLLYFRLDPRIRE